VPPVVGVAVVLDWSFTRAPFRNDDGSSRIVGAAMEDRDVRSIDVLGRRLLLVDTPLESSELVLLTDIWDDI